MFSTLAIALLALLANPAPVALAQLAKPPVAAKPPMGVLMISGIGLGTNILAADAAAAANLAAEEARLKARWHGQIWLGPVTTIRTLTLNWWPLYTSQYQTIMTRNYSIKATLD